MAHRCFLPAVCLLTALGTAPLLTAGETDPAVRFETQIQPILAAKCGKCHGEEKQTADLNLGSVAGIQRGGESGPVVAAGKPDDSPLYEKIQAGEMPPEDNPSLTKAEIELVRRWIAQGAKLPESPSGPSVTQHQIVPLMLLRCTACHGGRRKEADLDLRTKAGMLRGGKSGPAVIPGKPEESLLIKRIKAEEMPPRRLLVSVSVKPMEATELKMLETWVAEGLPESPIGPDVATTEPDKIVTDEDRNFWSFRPPSHVKLPDLSTSDRALIRTPIDGFLLVVLREHGLSFSPEADRATLIRRLSFDLVGSPPRPEDVAAFVADESPLAYELLVERLLASPHYGERWGRHWLDVAGYADSEGSQNEDRVRPNMWRFRDYVIRAFNSDKSYDRFLHEQLAGDELADFEHAAEITDEIYDNLAATGFLRTAPDRTFAGITNFVPDRLELVADEMQILGSAVMGLTLHCARCHSHKFDPLPQRDYYRLAATLKDALDEHDWMAPEVRQLKFVTSLERKAWEQHEQEITARLAPLQGQLAAEKDEAAKKTLQDQINRITGERRPEPTIRALWSRGGPSPTYVLKRGNYLTPGVEVGPGVPSMLTDGKTPFAVEPPWRGAKTTGRRLALARWLTTPDHPLTARVAVNRLWKHHFGVGLVPTLGNFGKTGAPPSHPELLDYLATEFVRSGWSIKEMHRLMVTSAAYRQSSQLTAELAAADPDNRWLSRMPLRRIEAEIVRDSLLSVAGQLDETPFGPPDDVQERSDGLVTVKSANGGGRRSVYVLHRRTKLPTILENFDSPQMGPNCLERGESIVAPQALHMLNNAAVHDLARLFAERVQREAGNETEAQIVRAYELAFGVAPSADERQVVLDSLEKLTQAWQEKLGESPEAKQQATGHALTNYCHAILNSSRFIYID